MNIAIFGITGYTGQELKKVLTFRNDIKIVYIASTRSRKEFGKMEEADIAIFALPHEKSMEKVPKILPQMDIIDLSGAYRLNNPELYPKYYEWEHKHPDLLKLAVYGLPEKNREAIKTAHLIAAPGCYETVTILALLPIIKQGFSIKKVWIDATSGYTGAGIEAPIPKNITPYKLGRSHQHIPVIEQELGIPEKIAFFPKEALYPRGIEATILVSLDCEKSPKNINALYRNFYKIEPFVRVKKKVNLTDVIETNFCDIAIEETIGSWVKISAVIDNLGKGASWQAIQILNIKMGLPETTGLL